MTFETTSRESPKAPRPYGWDEWYRFAHVDLAQSHAESVEYANLRYVEERNRESGRDSGADPSRR